MNSSSLLRLLVCIAFVGLALWAHIDRRNSLIELQLLLPQLEKEVLALKNANMVLQYSIDRFESPIHLLELAKKPEFGHLHYPYQNEVIVMQEESGWK